MKYEKFVVPVSVSAAVIAAAIAAIVVTNNRAAVARARAAEAESLEIANAKAEKEARLNAEAAAARSRQAADDRKKAEAEREAKIAERDKADADAKAAEAAKTKAKLDAEAESNRARAASDLRATEKAKADAARAVLEQENARIAGELALSNAAVAEATAKLETEKRKTEAIIAEATALKLRKIDFEQLQRDLIEFKQELDERERALHPDTTIYDASNVTWVAEREADVIGGETNRFPRVKKVLPENDPLLPKATRELAKQNRVRYETSTNGLAATQAKLIGRLEELRAAALREDRVIDADFYLKTIKSLYPDYQK